MGNITMSEVLIIAAALTALFLLMRRSDASITHRYSRVPVRTDDHYRGQAQPSEPVEEELDPAVWMEWFLFGSLLLVIAMLMGKL